MDFKFRWRIKTRILPVFFGFLGIFGSILFWNKITHAEILNNRLPLSIVTYNIRSCDRGKERVSKTIKKLNPDIVFLQEVHGPNFIPNFIDQAQYLGESLQFHHSFAKARLWITGEYGVAILSRFPIEEKTVIPLPNLPGEEQEILLELKVRTPLGFLILMTTHLISKTHQKGHDERPLRYLQAQRILNRILEKKDPVIFGGDLNTYGKSKIKSLYQEHLVDVFKAVGKGRSATFPARLPLARIDYLYVKGPFQLWQSKVIRSYASDHRPLWAQIEWVITP